MIRKTSHTDVLKTKKSYEFIAAENILIAIYELGLQLLATKSQDELYHTIVRELKKLISAKYISIYLVQKNELRKVFTSFSKLNNVRPRKDGFTYKAFREDIPYILDNRNIITIHPEVHNLGIKTTLFIPLSFELEPIGVLSIDFVDERKIPQYIIDSLKLLGSLITFKLKNLHLQKQLVEMTENQHLFISLASHELKNPLTALKGFASIMDRQMKKKQTVELRTIDSLHKEIDRLSKLINELLSSKQTDKTVSLKYEMNCQNVREIIHHTITNFRFSYPKRTIIFQDNANADCEILGDYNKLTQVLSNILTNAAKFSSPQTLITLDLTSSKKNITIQVADLGKGIQEQDIPHIFDRFYRGGSSHNNEGMGLGLFLSKKIVQEHNGTISIESNVGKGTQVTISFPKHT